jgi:hypothetical protein
MAATHRHRRRRASTRRCSRSRSRKYTGGFGANITLNLLKDVEVKFTKDIKTIQDIGDKIKKIQESAKEGDESNKQLNKLRESLDANIKLFKVKVYGVAMENLTKTLSKTLEYENEENLKNLIIGQIHEDENHLKKLTDKIGRSMLEYKVLPRPWLLTRLFRGLSRRVFYFIQARYDLFLLSIEMRAATTVATVLGGLGILAILVNL